MKATLQGITVGRVEFLAEVTTDVFCSDDGLVEAGFSRHHRISRYDDRDHSVLFRDWDPQF